MADYSIRILSDSLKVIDALSAQRRPLTFTQISDLTKLNKTRLFRILSNLVDLHLVDEVNGNYLLGWRLFEIGQTVPQVHGFRLNTHESLRQLSDFIGETANFGVLTDGEILFMDVAEADRTLTTTFKVGSRLPAHLTSIGKAILASWSEQQVIQFFKGRPFVRLTPNSVRDLNHLLEQLKVVRERGWALDDQEFAEGVRCVGVGVKNYAGQTVAAVSISGPASRITDDKIPDIVSELQRVAEEFSRVLGWGGLNENGTAK
ncbi:MAG: IclR family transcriptional regulator [Candidatus Fermentithermobacillus carboniphilus]|uniref:IclR family transcriptional regulator n=1 Tax=Candidatus Fermentithermobacillus carboniphilus TaxID=3085328 RepID=A0AAT9LHE3_9FIRM|nr:MAG: IclR family transcriptional regulator [Candidatus Fermentithermobacillus carboniphilus]